MSSLKEFQCEICGTVSENPIHWFVIECGDQKLEVIKWDLTAAGSPPRRISVARPTPKGIIAAWFNPVSCPANPPSKFSNPPPTPLPYLVRGVNHIDQPSGLDFVS